MVPGVSDILQHAIFNVFKIGVQMQRHCTILLISHFINYAFGLKMFFDTSHFPFKWYSCNQDSYFYYVNLHPCSLVSNIQS